MRVFELAKSLEMSSKELMALLEKMKVKTSNHMVALDEKTVAKILAKVEASRPKAKAKSLKATKEKEAPTKKTTTAKKVSPPMTPTAVSAVPSTPVVKAVPPKPRTPPVLAPSLQKSAPMQTSGPSFQKPVLSPTREVVSAPPAAPKPIPEEKTTPAPVSVTTAVAAPSPLKALSLKVPLTVKELAEKLNISPSELIKRLMGMKILVTINQLLTEEPVRQLLKQYGYEYDRIPTLEEQLDATHGEEDQTQLKHRPPVVTFMGHVDHGKTSLLDAIRKSKVVETEAGGITQHIGAYRVNLPKGSITFLDTPGHEAFTSMRARGAHVTDIVVVVIAADDGVMPQTVEAIDHAKAAEATIVVALNKMDKPSADPERIKKQLLELGLTPEEWGGKTIVAGVSAKTGAGIDQLLELILLEAELLELKADPTKPARGIVLEAELSKGGGPIAHLLVQTGTLAVGDVIVSGPYWGRVRAMLDERGHRLKETGPSTPLELLGLNGVPKAGDSFLIVPDEKQAREVVLRRQESSAALQPSLRRAVTLEDFHRQLEAGRIKSLNLILKADVQGSVEALRESLLKISSEEVELKILHVGVGDVTVSDVLLAEASAAVVIAFHVGMSAEAQTLAKEGQVDVRLYRIIYEALADIRAALEGLLTPKVVETSLGRAKVLQSFKVSKIGTIAGSQVIKGKITRGSVARVYRGKEQIHQGKVSSLRRVKEDVREVAEGIQCGIGVSGWSDFQPDDIIESIDVQQVAAKL